MTRSTRGVQRGRAREIVDTERKALAAGRKLNLGCGEYKKPGFINVDHAAAVKPDVVSNLDAFPYPFRDQSFRAIEADHVLEHLSDPFRAMRELHRILEVGGTLVVRVPHFSRGFTHPEHKRGFDVSFPYYFDPAVWGWYTKAEFALERVKLVWFAQPYMKKQVLPAYAYYFGAVLGRAIDFFANLSPFLCSRLWCFWVGGFEEIEFRFVRRR
jgi:SAM-dependent methyltransferase